MRTRWPFAAELVDWSSVVGVVMWLSGGMPAMAPQEAVLSAGYEV